MLPYILVILYICASFHAQEAQDTTFTIPLNETKPDAEEELYSSIINLKGGSRTDFIFTDIRKNVSYIIFQAHSYHYNITMCSDYCPNNAMAIGTNIGLYSAANPVSNFTIFNPNENDLKIMIAVHGYTDLDPVPGGCYMEGPIERPPFLTARVSPNRDYITILSASPSPSMVPGHCRLAPGLDMYYYRMYLPERDFSEDTYFGGIKAMMNRQSLMENGELIANTHIKTPPLRRTLSAYPGTGVVIVALVHIEIWNNATNTIYEGNSLYVPTVTYGCEPLIENDCLLLGDLLSQSLCASLLFVGLFVCYFGHKFFKTEMFLFGMLSGVIVTYILISLIAEMEQGPLLGASFLSGILFGFIWLTFWWFYGIPVFSVLLVTLTFGYFAACVLYNQIPGGLVIMMEDLNFWTLFILIMLVTAVTLAPATYPANILCCAILGAYAAIYPIDYCIGSNLKYIIINSVRRATVENFRYAVLSPPFEIYDAILILLWVMLATTGFLFQHYHNRGKPPFPPQPRNIRETPEGYSYGTNTPYIRVESATPDPPLTSSANVTDERTPLLS